MMESSSRLKQLPLMIWQYSSPGATGKAFWGFRWRFDLALKHRTNFERSEMPICQIHPHCTSHKIRMPTGRDPQRYRKSHWPVAGFVVSCHLVDCYYSPCRDEGEDLDLAFAFLQSGYEVHHRSWQRLLRQHYRKWKNTTWCWVASGKRIEWHSRSMSLLVRRVACPYYTRRVDEWMYTGLEQDPFVPFHSVKWFG